jgi:thiosulfate reductase cytochrome b subunit
LWVIAILHLLGAFGLVAFFIGHVYLTTTSETPTANLKAMVVDWEDLSDEEAVHLRSPTD